MVKTHAFTLYPHGRENVGDELGATHIPICLLPSSKESSGTLQSLGSRKTGFLWTPGVGVGRMKELEEESRLRCGLGFTEGVERPRWSSNPIRD